MCLTWIAIVVTMKSTQHLQILVMLMGKISLIRCHNTFLHPNMVSSFQSWTGELNSNCEDKFFYHERKKDLFNKIFRLYAQSKIRCRKTLVRRFVPYMAFFDGHRRTRNSNIAVLLDRIDSKLKSRGCRAGAKHKKIDNQSHAKSKKSHR